MNITEEQRYFFISLAEHLHDNFPDTLDFILSSDVEEVAETLNAIVEGDR